MANKGNLKRGGNVKAMQEGRKNAAEVRKISRKLILDPVYQAKLKEKLQDGSLHPSMQSLLFYYAFGKPVETEVEKPVTPVTFEMILDPNVVKAHEPK